MNHASVKRMLSNKKYLGTDYYPQIIDKEIQIKISGRTDTKGKPWKAQQKEQGTQ